MESPPKNKKNAKYSVGVIGCGVAATSRARAFDQHPMCEVVAIADTDPENLEVGCKRFGVPGYSTYDEMFANEQIDIAMPVLPVRPNADAVVASARAGVKAVFCEKPLTARLSDADRMVEACRSRGVHFAAGEVVSSHPDYQRAYEMAASGELGEVSRINLYDGNDQGGCHGLNLARKFADKADVDFVVGWVEGNPDGDYQDDYGEGEPWFGKIGGYIRFANGIECFSSYGDVGWRGIEVVGSLGALHNRDNTGRGLRIFKASRQDAPARATLSEVEGAFQTFDPGESGYDEEGWREPGEVMRHIVQAIVDSLETGAELKVTTGVDLRQALEIAIALRESHRRGHAPVKLPLKDRRLVMYPAKMRWNYKKDLFGSEWYMDMLARQKID